MILERRGYIMFELQLAAAENVVDYDLTNFDEICRFFEDHNKGLESPWSWEDAFNIERASFQLLWDSKISMSQHNRLCDAIHIPLF